MPYSDPEAARQARSDPAPVGHEEPDFGDLVADLDAALVEPPADDVAHARRLTLVVTLCCEAFRRYGLRAVLVGGGVIEFQLPGAYTTPDIDLVISRGHLAPPRALLDQVFGRIGFRTTTGRHWQRNDVLVEVPGWDLAGPIDYFQVGPYRLPGHRRRGRARRPHRRVRADGAHRPCGASSFGAPPANRAP